MTRPGGWSAEDFEGFLYGGTTFGALTCLKCGALVEIDKAAVLLHRRWHAELAAREHTP